VPIVPQRIFEGHLLGIADNEKTLFYSWDDLSRPIHKLDIAAEKVWWD
jgi:hypothetical protein